MSRSLSIHVKNVVGKKGKEILADPHAFAKALQEQGVAKEQGLMVELILTAVPPVAAALQGEEPGRTEVAALIGYITAETSLTPEAARRYFGALYVGVFGKLPAGSIAHGGLRARSLRKALSVKEPYPWQPMDAEEERQLRNARRRLASGVESERDEALSALSELADRGNPEACYALAEYLRQNNTWNNTKDAYMYFRQAALGGYGAAYGALASLELENPEGSLGKAVRYLSHPLAVQGKDGRKWASVVPKLKKQRETNVGNAKVTMALSLLTVILAILLFPVQAVAAAFALCVGIVTFLQALVVAFYANYYSCRLSYLLFTAVWFVAALLLI